MLAYVLSVNTKPGKLHSHAHAAHAAAHAAHAAVALFVLDVCDHFFLAPSRQ